MLWKKKNLKEKIEVYYTPKKSIQKYIYIYIFLFRYIKMSKNLSANYYQEIKEE